MKLARLILLGLFLGALSAPGLAAESKPEAEAKSERPADAKANDEKSKDKKGDKKEGEEPKKDDSGLFNAQDNLVPLPTLIAPVLCNNRLTAHLYIYIAAMTANASDANVVKKRLPYVQDALVRDVNNNVLVIDNLEAEPDTKSMLARFKSVINAAVGKPLVTDIQVGKIDTAPY